MVIRRDLGNNREIKVQTFAILEKKYDWELLVKTHKILLFVLRNLET